MIKRRLPILVALVLVIAVAFAVVGLPLTQLGFTPVQAEYSGCGSTYQLRLYGDTGQTYADVALSIPSVVITGVVNGTRQKYLICDPISSPTTANTVLALIIADQVVYIKAGAGQIVPRQYTDAQ